MPTTVTPLPTRPPPCVGPAPPGWTYALYFRRTQNEAWQEVCRSTSAEELWRRSLEMPTGHYREVMVRVNLFDATERGGR